MFDLDEVLVAGEWGLPSGGALLPCDLPAVEWPDLGELAPGSGTAESLERLPLPEADEYDVVEAVAAWEKLAAFAHARQVVAMAELTRRPMFAELSSLRDGVDSTRAVALELSARLRISVQEAQRRVALAQELVEDRPDTLAALGRGQIDYWRAKTIADAIRVTDAESARRVEQRILPQAGELSRAALRNKVERALLAIDPVAAEQRHERALADRQVRCRPEVDGMGSTWALLSAHDTAVLDRVLDAAAEGLARDCPADGRTHAQRRADALAAMAHAAWKSGWIGGCARCTASPASVSSGVGATTGSSVRLSGRGRRIEIGVLVPFSTLIGLDDDPAELIGYGPITA